MKTKWMMWMPLLTMAMMMKPVESRAFSPALPMECHTSHYEENIKSSKHIVVARLEKYLPDFKGEFRVLMTLRGDIMPGATIIERAVPIPNDPTLVGGSGDPLGHNYIFFAEKHIGEADAIKLTLTPCDNRYSAQKLDNTRPAFDPIIDYILEKE